MVCRLLFFYSLLLYKEQSWVLGLQQRFCKTLYQAYLRDTCIVLCFCCCFSGRVAKKNPPRIQAWDPRPKSKTHYNPRLEPTRLEPKSIHVEQFSGWLSKNCEENWNMHKLLNSKSPPAEQPPIGPDLKNITLGPNIPSSIYREEAEAVLRSEVKCISRIRRWTSGWT